MKAITTHFLIISALTFTLVGKTYGGAANVLQVDVSNPAAVTITGIPANFSTTPANSMTEGIGIDLGFFFTTTGLSFSGSASGNLTPAGSGTVSYDSFSTDSYGSEFGANSLNIFLNGSSIAQNFVSGDVPFTGTLTLDLSSLAAYLPEVGDGDGIMIGNSANPGQTIFSWQVVAPVPEPNTLALAGISGIGAVLFFRRRAA